MAAIEIEGLSKAFGETQAVDDLSLDVDEGELFGFLGPNGAGKTTTIRLLTGRIDPDEGQMRVLGASPADSGTDVRELVGILPEKESPMDFMTPREYLQFVGMTRGMDDEIVDERTQEWAQRLSFEDKLDTFNTDLSRGQQQKVMIAGGFLHEPDLVFIDEPLANLDPIMQERVKEYLVEYVEAGNTLFLSTHQIGVAEEICTRVGIIDGGQLVTERETATLDGDDLVDTFIEDVSAPEAWNERGDS